LTDEEFYNNTAFCPAPWTTFYIWGDGRVENCCQSKNELGDLNHDSIYSILKSNKVIQIKQDMLAGKQVSGCKACYPQDHTIKSDDFNFKSTMRYDFLEFQENSTKEIYSDVNAFVYRYADLRFRNTCNYACVYCGPLCSSLWAEEIDKHDVLDKDKINDLIQYYLDNISKINYLYIAGGEPLLIKENQIILDKLSQVNLNCNISINTNLSLITNNKIYETLLKFKTCHWIVSFDDMEDRYNYIRYPGDWNNFYNNLIKLKKDVGVENISFSMTYTSLNAKSIFQAIEALTKEGFNKNCFNIYYVHSGQKNDYLNPKSLPQSYINETINIIQQNLIDKNLPSYNSKDERFNNQLNHLISFLENDCYYESTLIEDLQSLDKRRNLDSKKVFPEIYNLFDQ